MSMNLVTLLYLVASICFIQALKGLSHPTTSIRGNLFGMAGMTIAVLTTAALIVALAGSALGLAWVLLGLVIGVIVLLGGGWTFLAFVTRFNGDVGFGLAVGLLVAYIVVAIVFAVRPSTSRLGAGLLLAIGAVLVILAGLCFGLVFGVIR